MEEKSVLASATNWVSLFAPVLTAVFVAVGIPIPGDALAPVIVSVVQSAATWWARNRKNGGAKTTYSLR